MKDKKTMITVALLCIVLYALSGWLAIHLFAFSDGTAENGNYVNLCAHIEFLRPDDWTDIEKSRKNGMTSFFTSDGKGAAVTISLADNVIMSVKDPCDFAHSAASDIDPAAKEAVYTVLAGEEYSVCYAQKDGTVTAVYVRLIRGKVMIIGISAENMIRIREIAQLFVKRVG
ncbi:MAG: hypothetical protein IJB86_06390 [Clostridia bacterium]|nr:hypothetical protein [Clostridia bacterium]